MFVDNIKFNELFQRLSNIDLFGVAGPALPYSTPPSSDGVEKAISKGANLLPAEFRNAYVDPLEANLTAVVAKLNSSQQQETIETLAGAVYQHAEQEMGAPLGRFLAVISDLYRSFLSKKRRAAAGFPLLETLPPLAMFQRSGLSGPFTIPCDDVVSLFRGTVGVVSLPATYSQHPLLWASLSHETGGHDVTHADADLLPELAEGIHELFGGGPITPGKPLTEAQFLGLLWTYWLDEAAADVYGVLNIGPAFGLNLAVFFAALNARASGNTKSPHLRTESGFDPSDPGRRLDEHPTDILRPHIVMGVVDALDGLKQPVRDGYLADLQALVQICAPNASTVTLSGVIQTGPGVRITVQQKFALAKMQQTARQVGSFIARKKLQALSGHSIQELETWDDRDEQTARNISIALLNNASVADQGDDAQLLAGATLAAFQSPGSYDQISKLLADALDVSLADDPFFGSPTPDRIMLRAASTQLPLDPSVAADVCEQCIRATANISSDPIGGQDTMSDLGIGDKPALTSLVDRIEDDAEIGLPSVGYVINNRDSLQPKTTTTFSQLIGMVVKNSRPA